MIPYECNHVERLHSKILIITYRRRRLGQALQSKSLVLKEVGRKLQFVCISAKSADFLCASDISNVLCKAGPSDVWTTCILAGKYRRDWGGRRWEGWLRGGTCYWLPIQCRCERNYGNSFVINSHSIVNRELKSAGVALRQKQTNKKKIDRSAPFILENVYNCKKYSNGNFPLGYSWRHLEGL